MQTLVTENNNNNTTLREKRENSFYADLVNIMTNPSFQQFCTKYMSSWTDMETMCMYIKLYQALSQYLDSPSDVMSVIDRVMHNAPARRKTIEDFRKFQQGRVLRKHPQLHEEVKAKKNLKRIG
jgi:hypothetical protein